MTAPPPGVPAPDADQPLPAATAGSADAALLQVYEELRRLAKRRLAAGMRGQTLQATALVHEVWLKLAGNPELKWRDTHHFQALAAQAMRWILTDRARRQQAAGRPARAADATLSGLAAASAHADPLRTLALDDALEQLRAIDGRKAEVVQLRHFGGLSVEETGAALDISPATVKREWTLARAWLLRALAVPPRGRSEKS